MKLVNYKGTSYSVIFREQSDGRVKASIAVNGMSVIGDNRDDAFRKLNVVILEQKNDGNTNILLG